MLSKRVVINDAAVDYPLPLKMRTCASVSHSSCDDLHLQKSSCVVVHTAVFAQSDHRNLNAVPVRNFASSWVRGIVARIGTIKNLIEDVIHPLGDPSLRSGR